MDVATPARVDRADRAPRAIEVRRLGRVDYAAGLELQAQLVEQRRLLVDDVRRLTNRITNALKQYFPQPLEWFKDKDTLVFCDFLTQWPTLKQVQRARKTRLSTFFYEHNVRYPHIIEQRIRAITSATAITFDPAVIEPNRLLVEALVGQLRPLLQAVERFEQSIAKLAPTLDDYVLFASFPDLASIRRTPAHAAMRLDSASTGVA
jgi:hypothetical protein